MTTPRRAQRPPRPVQVELAERLADPRPAGPVVDRVGDAGERAVAVAVAQQARDAREPRPEHERLRPDRRCGRERLDEPQQQPRVALHRARDVAEHDERPRPLDRAPPDPRHDLAAGPEVAPEHRPRREPAAVAVELVAARPAPLQLRDQEVDEALGVAQLRRRHPVELAMAQDLAAASTRRARRRRPRSALLVRCVVARRPGSGCRAPRAGVDCDSSPASGSLAPACVGRPARRRRPVAAAAAPGSRPAREPRAPPEAVEDRVVDLEVVAPADEDRRAGGPDLLAVADVDDVERAGEVDRRPEVDRQPGGAQRPPEPDGLARAAGGRRPRRRTARWTMAGSVIGVVLSRRRRPRPGSARTARRGPGGCPPRT